MARAPAAVNGGWPTPQHPNEPDPRNPRAGAQGQRPGQPAGYPQQSAYPPAYDPQSAYHYPQNGQAPAQPDPRQGLSSLDPAAQPAHYPAPYGQPQQPQGQSVYRPAPAYGAPGHQPDPMPDPHAAAGYDQWQMGAPQDPRGYGGFAPRPGAPGPHDQLQAQPDWAPGAHLGYAEPVRDPYGAGQMGYEPVHGGALEQSYAQDEGADYETDEPRRGSWALRIAGAIVVAIGLGYGLAQGYKLVAGSAPDGAPPVVRNDSAPAKTTPSDPGGKQFAHADTKIMGRLGEGAPGSETSGPAPEPETDANGARKVQTLVVGRDGSITPPAAPEQPVTTGAVPVPGLTVVDGFGGRYPQAEPSAAPSAPAAETAQPAAARQPIVVKPPAAESKPVVVAKAAPAQPETTDAAPPEAAASAPAEPTKMAVAAPPPASSGTNGYVVVLASVPASGESRLAALKKFADMQQTYGSVLQSRTPDVQEANLGAKGTYHRLLVGPPGSRAQANTLCNDLKAAGYKDCWVMAY